MHIYDRNYDTLRHKGPLIALAKNGALLILNWEKNEFYRNSQLLDFNPGYISSTPFKLVKNVILLTIKYLIKVTYIDVFTETRMQRDNWLQRI